MSLEHQVLEVFAAGGLLQRSSSDFQPRAGQTEMALAIARTLQEGGELVVEAGTGIGKTFAYLVPALLSGTRVLLSTATKTLQDQLYGRDLPMLLSILGLPVRTALLKGRSSYLCQHRLAMARHDSHLDDALRARTLAKIETWAMTTRTGDLAELPGLDERSPVLALVTSSRDNCLGAQCPRLRECHVNQARRNALAADVVVINHHLFFADLAVRESGMAELLPSVQTLIFDEAHRLNDTGVQFLGHQLSTGQLLDLSRDVLGLGQQHARGLADWPALSADLANVARDLRMLVGQGSAGVKLAWAGTVPDQVDASEWRQALAELELVCTGLKQTLDVLSDTAPDLARLAERCEMVLAHIVLFSGPCAVGSVRWLDIGMQLRLVESPLDISHALQTRGIQPLSADGARRAWVFTSATLGQDERLSWFTEPCGLDDATVLRVNSPFNYATQAALYVPENLVRPGEPGHSAQVAELAGRLAQVIGGRTLVLTTTLRALEYIGLALQKRFSGSGELDILVQGQRPKRALIDRFREGQSGGQAGCILVASASFWEGVDVPGDALQLLLIDKLPFPVPGDPLVEAHGRRLEAAQRNVFKDYFLPETAMALKQGAGRLIRRESDQGVLVVCDARLTRMGYGQKLMKALPPMRRLESEDQLLDALRALTKTSTTVAQPL
jgi:ATP-dependent DNA helicase DinG